MKLIGMNVFFLIASVGAQHGATEEESNDAVVVTPCVVLTGADSHVRESECHRITSMKDWIALWQKHKKQQPEETYDLHHDPLGLPLIDFDRFMVIGIFQGTGWNSAGLKVVSVSEQPHRIVFRFDRKSYQTAGPDGGGKRVTVYGFFVVTRSLKPVILEENVQQYLGQPPVWKERTTFPNRATNLTKEDVLQIAEAAAKSNGFDLGKYDLTGCDYESTRKDHTWTVFYVLKPPTPPGGHFLVWVDDQTKKATLAPGE